MQNLFILYSFWGYNLFILYSFGGYNLFILYSFGGDHTEEEGGVQTRLLRQDGRLKGSTALLSGVPGSPCAAPMPGGGRPRRSPRRLAPQPASPVGYRRRGAGVRAGPPRARLPRPGTASGTSGNTSAASEAPWT